MISPLPEPVERVAGALREAGGEGRIEEFRQPTPTAEDAARAAGCTLAQIVKTIVLLCDGAPAAALVPGDRRGDTRKVGRHLGAARVRVATADEVLELTGFAPGAVAPFPLPRIEHVLLEQTLLAHPLVWVGAGSPRHLLGLAPAELVRVARAEPVDLVRDPA